MYCLAKYIAHPIPKNYQRYGLWAESYIDRPLEPLVHALILFVPGSLTAKEGSLFTCVSNPKFVGKIVRELLLAAVSVFCL